MTVSFNGLPAVPPSSKKAFQPRFGIVTCFDKDPVGKQLQDHFVKVTCKGKVGRAFADEPESAIVMSHGGVSYYLTGEDKEYFLAEEEKLRQLDDVTIADYTALDLEMISRMGEGEVHEMPAPEPGPPAPRAPGGWLAQLLEDPDRLIAAMQEMQEMPEAPIRERRMSDPERRLRELLEPETGEGPQPPRTLDGPPSGIRITMPEPAPAPPPPEAPPLIEDDAADDVADDDPGDVPDDFGDDAAAQQEQPWWKKLLGL